ncbi:MAG: SDR family oxidoreductase [Verrucomicrobiales bacterium]|nr:SDR family oxidoreductase [Verrucomicrobiales bacterium]
MSGFFSLGGKVAVVTGGSSGIGAAIVTRFRAAGAVVVIADRLEPPEEKGEFVRVDVSSEAEVSSALESVVAKHGNLDLLVNNAGIQPLGVRFEDLTESVVRRTFDVNVNGTIWGIKHGSRLLSPGGRIVNLSSFVGLLGVPAGTAYAASKAAVAHLTKCAALELAPRAITVNAIAPGTIRTPAVEGIPDNPEIPFAESRTPMGRLGMPAEVAAAAHFLCSDEASFITGVILPVDGGIAAGWERYDLTLPSEISPDGSWHDPES